MLNGWMLTTNHPTSSYGMPVFVFQGVGYGPRDRISAFLVADIVKSWAEADERTDSEKAQAGKFLRQWPDGPQLSRVPGVMGPPRQFPKTDSITFRLESNLAALLPKERKAKGAFLRAATREKMEKDGLL